LGKTKKDVPTVFIFRNQTEKLGLQEKNNVQEGPELAWGLRKVASVLRAQIPLGKVDAKDRKPNTNRKAHGGWPRPPVTRRN